ncbi:hypothetical protein EA004_10290 [Vibrio anguillarum]|uniref:Tetratricopeptide repeat protein n=2 Tax=Vibrio anguillarum TaxID=55601 RepID=A0ABR9Z6U2_VIBAN|nr:hypothetical protein CEJ46_19455 [Vibrio anguillarum]ASO30583.1 hypothetical protein CG015_15035 [Vibrio anguillarum]ATC59931.1 hypothetical protein CMV05_21465 [Vibrio anguillarum]MBF4245431.1 hypothetical protein [Vibrio anguillarum]MBF4249626.1 hypothetical protein [Vibrio anguillarum]
MSMDLQQCWTSYLKAEQLLAQGHWPQAHCLFEDVLHHMPSHIQSALNCEHTKPCQLVCLISGLCDAAVSQSEIFNHLGQHKQAFDVLNQSYALLQFTAIEPNALVNRLANVLTKQSDDLLKHMSAFCSAQRSATWMLEFEHVQKAHHYFNQLKRYNQVQAQVPSSNCHCSTE